MTIGGIGASVRVLVEGHDEGLVMAALRTAWSRAQVRQHAPLRGEPVRVSLQPDATASRRGGARVVSSELKPLLQATTQAVTASLITAQAGRLLMFHAGAVAHPETGDSVVFVAAGGTGKTTLTRLAAQRYGYLTDETVAVDGSGVILPYPKPLSVRSAHGGPKAELSPDDLDLVRAPAGARVRQLVLLRRRDDHVGVRVETLGLMDAILGLTPETSSLGRLDRGLHRLADLINATGPVQRWNYAEATDLMPLLGQVLEA